MEIPFKRTKGGITIEVKVAPRSSRAEIQEVRGNELGETSRNKVIKIEGIDSI
jgi:uncharacterized protein YggU (UPF0235/DUF167 family)